MKFISKKKYEHPSHTLGLQRAYGGARMRECVCACVCVSVCRYTDSCCMYVRIFFYFSKDYTSKMTSADARNNAQNRAKVPDMRM